MQQCTYLAYLAALLLFKSEACCTGAHSDFGLLTLLVTEQPGLQISLEDGWTDLHTEPDSIIVNLGDELQRHAQYSLITSPFTQGCYHSKQQALSSSFQIFTNSSHELQRAVCRCTNDAFKSMRHRVVSNGRDRYSVAFFVNADYDCTLQCLPVSLCGP